MEQLRLLAETLSITGTLNLNHRPTLPYPTKRMNIEQLLHSLAERVSASALRRSGEVTHVCFPKMTREA